MLKLLNEENLADILDFCKGSILGTRISCYALCYGFDRNFLMFWGSYSTHGLTSVIAKFYDDVTVLSDKISDFSEISEFLSIVGYNTLTTSENNAKLLNHDGYIVKKGFIYSSDSTEKCQCDNASESDLRNIYSLISAVIPDSFSDTEEAFMEFKSDYIFRYYKGFANAVCIRDGENIAACALTSAQSNNSVLLSGVACDNKLRKTGYGKSVVLGLTNRFLRENKSVYVIALNETAEGFYKHIGFKEVEKIAFINRKV